MEKSYQITESTISLIDSTDEAELITIKHSEGQITLCFAYGKLYSAESIDNGIKTKIK
jgi:hypothetical protein